MREPDLDKVPTEWATTWETGINWRTLSRFLNNGWVEMERREGKRWWRRAKDKSSPS